MLGINAGKKREIAQHHETLDVVRVGLTLCLIDALSQAAQLCIASPIEIRKRTVCIQRVSVSELGHIPPVHAANILAPSDDLTDEPLSGV